MSTFDLSAFRSSALPQGGARPTLFTVQLTFPFATAFQGITQFQVRTASIPAAQMDVMRVPYMGRAVKLQGDRPDFPDWTVSVLNDENFPLRVAFEKWSNLMNGFIDNTMDPSVFPLDYKTTARVTQYGKTGDVLRSYIIDGLFPINVDQMQLDWDAQNQLQTYDVTFALDWAYPDPQTQTNSDDFNALSGTQEGSVPTGSIKTTPIS